MWHSHKGKLLEETKIQWLPVGAQGKVTLQQGRCKPWNYGNDLYPDCDDGTWTPAFVKNEHYHESKEVNLMR